MIQRILPPEHNNERLPPGWQRLDPAFSYISWRRPDLRYPPLILTYPHLPPLPIPRAFPRLPLVENGGAEADKETCGHLWHEGTGPGRHGDFRRRGESQDWNGKPPPHPTPPCFPISARCLLPRSNHKSWGISPTSSQEEATNTLAPPTPPPPALLIPCSLVYTADHSPCFAGEEECCSSSSTVPASRPS